MAASCTLRVGRAARAIGGPAVTEFDVEEAFPEGEQPAQLEAQLLAVGGLAVGMAMGGDWEHRLALHVVVLAFSLACVVRSRAAGVQWASPSPSSAELAGVAWRVQEQDRP